MANNLLVIDFDYFFPNPMIMTNTTPDVMLYDWSAAEAPDGSQTLPDFIWETRAMSFLLNNQPLPMCHGYEDFWNRFTLKTGARIYVADSNQHAAYMFPNTDDIWDRIDLYDAHHDAGYPDGDNNTIHCGNWMLHHYTLGTHDLYVHYPPWRGHAENNPERPPIAPVNRTIDDGTKATTRYDMVFVCRSGAWVPSWCDHQFTEFINAAPRDPDYFAPRPIPRDFNMTRVNDLVNAQQHIDTNVQQILNERTRT